MSRTRTITIRQPWASLIVLGIKDVENRAWCTKYTGPLMIHASAAPPLILDLANADTILRATVGMTLDEVCPELPRGAIVGRVNLDGVGPSASNWAFRGCHHWHLSDAQPCTPVPATGRLGLWWWDGGES